MASEDANRSEPRRGNPLLRAAASVRRLFSRKAAPVTGDVGGEDVAGDDVGQAIPTVTEHGAPRPPRMGTARREADMPLDRIAQEYIPAQTSLKTPFRADGSDHQRDQEDYARRVADDRWKDEDRYTNRSNDPRIGTRGRSYEPGERSERPGND